jgi:hypothetical protein
MGPEVEKNSDELVETKAEAAATEAECTDSAGFQNKQECLACLADSSPANAVNRRIAARRIAEVGTPDDLDRFFLLLVAERDTEVAVREAQAIRRIAERNKVDLEPAQWARIKNVSCTALTDAKPQVRAMGLDLLGAVPRALEDPETFRTVVAALEDPEDFVQIWAACAICRAAEREQIKLSVLPLKRIADICCRAVRMASLESKHLETAAFTLGLFPSNSREVDECLVAACVPGSVLSEHAKKALERRVKRGWLSVGHLCDMLLELTEKPRVSRAYRERLNELAGNLEQIDDPVLLAELLQHAAKRLCQVTKAQDGAGVGQPSAAGEVERIVVAEEARTRGAILEDTRIGALADTVAEKVAEKLSTAGIKAKLKKPEPVLTQEQQEVFDEIDKLGSGAQARRTAEKLINQRLGGKPVTEGIAIALKECLKSRAWGIKCLTCGQPAAPVWQRSQTKGEGGALVLAHPTSKGGYIQHTSRTVMPKIRLVPRP